MACKIQTSWEGFPWKWVSGEMPLDILKMSHLHCMFGSNMSEMVWNYVGKTCVDMKRKQEAGMGHVFLMKPSVFGNHTDRARGLAFFSTTPG